MNLLPLGVDPHKFESDPASRVSVRETYNIPPDQVNTHIHIVINFSLVLSNQIAILYAARMIPQKQPMVMVNAFKILAARNVKFTGFLSIFLFPPPPHPFPSSPFYGLRNFTALVAGTGWQRPLIDEFISRHNLGRNVLILGEVPLPPRSLLVSYSLSPYTSPFISPSFPSFVYSNNLYLGTSVTDADPNVCLRHRIFTI